MTLLLNKFLFFGTAKEWQTKLGGYNDESDK
jgi:hypothetical protein